jgi:hypothetical protein
MYIPAIDDSAVWTMHPLPLTMLLPLVSCISCAAHAGLQEAGTQARVPMAGRRAPGARPSEVAFAMAIRDTLAERPESLEPATTALSGERYTTFARAFSKAEKPHCLGPDPMKHQPTSKVIGDWQFGVSGLFALPFWGAAIARGKCNW